MNRQTTVLLASTLMLAACNSGTTTTGPTPTTGESSFLTGTWRGTMTVHRDGLPDTTSPATWSFNLVANTAGTTFTSTLAVQDAWLALPSTTLSAAILPASPGGHLSTQGLYASPRGCQGAIGITGVASLTTIQGTVEGSDCQQLPAPVVFSGSVTLTKVGS